jgi:VWFA-related protein
MRTFGGIFRKCAGAASFLPTLMAFGLAWASPCVALEENTPPPQTEQAEMTSHDTSPTFQLKTERNLVMVRVVVRDSNGKPKGDLVQEDFRLLDNGKPQVISHFSVENPKSNATPVTEAAPHAPPVALAEESLESSTPIPHRFLAMFFDDVHLRMTDLMLVKMAGTKYVTDQLLPGDQVGVFTSSERTHLDFTHDQEKIRNAISQITPHPIAQNPTGICPDIFDYQAYLIIEHHDPFATEIATEEYFHCHCQEFADTPQMAAQCRQQGRSQAESMAQSTLQIYETNSLATLRSLKNLVRRLSAYPGQRTILLLSPGFLTRDLETQLDEIADLSLRANITVNGLDAKGLYAPTPGGDDITQDTVITPARPDLTGRKEQYRIDRLQATSEPLSSLAAGTGGFFFHDSNDLYEGFRRAGQLPDVYYILAFSPTNLKADGRFHSLKVSLAQPKGLSLQSRRGYFARKKSNDPATQANEEIQEAVFSPDDMNELPIDVHTQFFRVSDSAAKLSVMTHVDLRFVHFQKTEGKNSDNLVLVTALFDENGKYLTAQQKILEMHLRDATLSRLSPSGITLKTSFDVKPGSYLVRQVVRDAEGAELSGVSRSVQIPF